MERMDPVDPTEPVEPNDRTPTGRGAVCWAAVARGAGIGLVVLIGVATLRAVLDRNVEDFADSGWTLPLFVVLLAGYFLAGWVAQRHAAEQGMGDAPYTHGALAGIGAFACWIPLRIAIWLIRDEHRGLVRGSDGALRPGQLFGALVIAAGIGVLGGALAARRTPARSDVQP
jgi:hypothetical protein